MMRLSKLILVAALAVACAPPSPEAAAPAEAATGPYNVILFIGDGTGLNYWSAVRLAYPDPAIEQFPVVGLVGTTASNSWITDSAAGATAFASGVKTYNGAIGMDADTMPAETVLERAARRGKATGLVATATITHATPAAFAAHVPSRNMHFEIAAQMAEADVDVMLGGGRVFFDPAERPDSADLLAALRKRGVVADAGELAAMDLDAIDRLVAFTAAENPPSAIRRHPNLAQLTETALDVLARDDDGFFLMVEGSQIDWRGHDNAPLEDVLPEVQDLDFAIRAALRFRERHPNTLIVVTADHETGGLALHGDSTGAFRAHYTTDGHTAGMVPLFAVGPGAEALGGIRENDEVGRVLMGLITGNGPSSRR